MGVMKQSYLYLTRKRGTSCALFLFLLTIATMLLTCLTLYSATLNTEKYLKKALMGSFTVNAKQTEDGLSDETVHHILSMEGLSGQYVLRSYTQANYQNLTGKFLDIETEGAAYVPQGYEHAGKVVSSNHSEKDTYFTKAGFQLVQGTHITSEDKNTILIHEKFAAKNNLKIGDAIVLQDVSGSKEVEARVKGVFTNTKKQDAVGIAPSYDLYPNIVFTDIQTGAALLYGNDRTGSQYGDFYVEDPEKLESIIADVKKLPDNVIRQSIITKYDSDYQKAKKSLESLSNIIFTAVFVISALSFAVLSLFLIFRLRSRIYETGILLAMGMSKKRILSQYVLEVLMVAIIALLFSYAASTIIAQNAGAALISEAVQTHGTNMDVSIKDYITIWMICIGLCTGSIAIAILPIMKMKPKNILSQMN